MNFDYGIFDNVLLLSTPNGVDKENLHLICGSDLDHRFTSKEIKYETTLCIKYETKSILSSKFFMYYLEANYNSTIIKCRDFLLER